MRNQSSDENFILVGGDDDCGADASNPSDFDNSPAQWHPECSVDFQVVREENTYDDIMASQHVYCGGRVHASSQRRHRHLKRQSDDVSILRPLSIVIDCTKGR